VLRHWFVPEGASKAALRTHAISRLWWAAYLTYAPWDRDPELVVFKTADRFRFTRILLKQQQIYFDLVSATSEATCGCELVSSMRSSGTCRPYRGRRDDRPY
jgi:hypothetical protein